VQELTEELLRKILGAVSVGELGRSTVYWYDYLLFTLLLLYSYK
jgi:hypothetical protein